MRSMTFCVLSAVLSATALFEVSTSAASAGDDLRNICTGHEIPDENYCDQPYVVVTKDGNWLCTLTTGPGHESHGGQHVVATISADKGRTWSKLIDIEPSRMDGWEASWVMSLVVPSGRIYAFYDYNGDNFRSYRGKPVRPPTLLGWYVYKYSDDNGRTWSKERYRLPMPMAPVDRTNTFNGEVQMFWGIGEPIISGNSAFFAFSRIGKFVERKTEGWFYRSDNILTETDPKKIDWQLLPDGDVGLKNLAFGEVQAEQNIVALSDGSLYCMYRTQNGYPCHAYSRDGGHTWTMPEYTTYTPGGRKMKNPRACPRIWKTGNGKYLFWHHPHGAHKSAYRDRNPAWLSGGIEKDSFIHWSQPEIVLYDPDPKNCTFDPKTGIPGPHLGMSYPDLIEQDGRYWITETQKTVARVHEIDKSLLEDLWNQGNVKTVTRKGLVLDLGPEAIKRGEVDSPKLPNLSDGGGFAIDFWINLKKLSDGQVILDNRDSAGKGFVVKTAEHGAIRIEMNDGENVGFWSCDPDILKPGIWHHVAIIVDGGPNVITFVVDGMFCDGGEVRQYGWGRFTPQLSDVTGSGKLRMVPSLAGELKRVRIYNRYIRTSEAIANFHAGL